jgi:histidinol phosphatase-like enzyme
MSPTEMRLIEGAGKAISLLNKSNIKVSVITNQSIIGQGKLSFEELDQIYTLPVQYLLEQ